MSKRKARPNWIVRREAHDPRHGGSTSTTFHEELPDLFGVLAREREYLNAHRDVFPEREVRLYAGKINWHLVGIAGDSRA